MQVEFDYKLLYVSTYDLLSCLPKDILVDSILRSRFRVGDELTDLENEK